MYQISTAFLRLFRFINASSQQYIKVWLGSI